MVRPISQTNLALNRAPNPDGSGTPFSPDDIANLVAWYDPSDASRVTKVTTPDRFSIIENKALVTNDGSYLVVRSGNTLPLVGTMNSLECMSFDNTSRCMGQSSQAAATLLLGTGDFTLISVAQAVNGEDGLVFNKGASKRYRIRIRNNVHESDRRGATSGIVPVVGSTTVDDGTPHTCFCTFNGTTGKINQYTDGVVDGTEGTVSPVDTCDDLVGDAGQFIVGAAPAAGTATQANFNGLIAEILIYKAVLTSGEIGQVQAYLKSKWGTA